MRRTKINIIIYVIVLSLPFLFVGCTNNCNDILNKNIKEKFIRVEPICEQYLIENVISTGFDGKSFCTFDFLGMQEDKIYLWAYSQEYYIKDKMIKKGTGSFYPLVLDFIDDGNEFQIVSHHIPKDGELWGKDVKEMFPECIYENEILIEDKDEFQKKYNEKFDFLEKRNLDRANEFFHLADIAGVWILAEKHIFDTDTIIIRLINDTQFEIEILNDTSENTIQFDDIVYKNNELTYNTLENDTIKYYQFYKMKGEDVFTGGTLDSWEGEKEKIILHKINYPVKDLFINR